MTALHPRVPIPKNGVDYRGKIVLAPMVRSGECPSRLLALRYGADLVWGPETIDKALIGTRRHINPVTNTVDFTRLSSNGFKDPGLNSDQKESIIYRLHPSREGRKLIYQIGTSDPTTAVQAARLIAPDVAGIDVNAGCPKPFSTLGGMGAALLKTPDKLVSILEALVRDVGRPYEIGISVKIRILDTAEQTEALVRRLCATGITGLTVHCRTTPMRPREPAIRDQLHMIVSVCREAGVACLMNGDVASRSHAAQLMAEFGADGAMIATAAETNPSVFRPDSAGGLVAWDEIVREYVGTALDVENRWGNTKFLLGQMIPGKQAAYKLAMRCKSYSDLVRALEYTELEEAARDVDRRLELGAFEPAKPTKAERKRIRAAAAAAAAAAVATVEQHESAERSVGTKRTAAEAQLDLDLDVPPRNVDVNRDMAPGTLGEHAQTLAV